MPIYTFQCQKCGHEFEEQLLISDIDEPLNKPCPECKKRKSLKRVISVDPARIIFDSSRLMGISKPQAAFRSRMKDIHKGAGTMPRDSNFTEI